MDIELLLIILLVGIVIGMIIRLRSDQPTIIT